MSWISSPPYAPERVREETSLAPLLLQTEGLITDLLAERLGKPVTARSLEQRFDVIGFVRKSLLRANGFPLYIAVTVIGNIARRRNLTRALQEHPTMLLGEVLKKHRLYGHKTAPEIRRTHLTPTFQKLLEVDADATETWERTYAIVSPKNKRIAGVTEIFHPRLEAWLREHSDRVPPLSSKRTAETSAVTG